MPGLFASATLEQIRAASDIVDVIGSYVPLKRAGANFTALCPFHKEKSPSFNVNPHRQIFHCFGCHKGGDVFTFVKEYENITFPEAVKRLADRAKIPLEYDQNPAEQQSRDIKGKLLEIHEHITQRWQNALANEASGQVARDYLAKRGVSAEAIKLFRLGAAPDLWDDTVNWAKSKGHDLALVEKAGLILRKEGGHHFYDRFRGRLMFPICDEQGRVIGFSGRVLSGDEKTAKYVNSPETPIFTKSKVFFGLDKSKRAILDAGFAIICEGQLDLIACFMAGVQNVVAPQGTAFTEQHARILRRYVERIVLCFDSDNAGQSAAIRSLDTLLESGPDLFVQTRDKKSSYFGRHSQKIIYDLLPSGLSISVAVVPAPHDPDSYIREFGVNTFQNLINNAHDFFDFLLDRLCKTNDAASDLGRRTILEAMREAVQKTGNAVLVDKYAQKTAGKLGVSADAVRVEFKKISRAKPSSADAPEEVPEEISEAQRPSAHEFWLLKLIFRHEELAGWCSMNIEPDWIQHSLARQIFSKRVEAHRTESWSSLGGFLDECGTPEMRSLITEAATEERPMPDPAQQLADVALRLRNQYIDRQMMTISQRINHPETNDTVREELLREQQQLRQLKRQPLNYK
jgi:DNA primase